MRRNWGIEDQEGFGKGMKLALVVSDTEKAQDGAEPLRASHDWVDPQDADTLVVGGGDGFLLHTLHEMLDWDQLKPCYGLNLGTVGFLMNSGIHGMSIEDRVAKAQGVSVRPLHMRATTQEGR